MSNYVERGKIIRNAFWNVVAVNGVAVVVFIWAILSPAPAHLIVCYLMVSPIINFLSVANYKRVIGLNSGTESIFASPNFSFWPVVPLGYFSFSNHLELSKDNYWIPLSVFLFLLTFLLFYLLRNNIKKIRYTFVWLAVCGYFGSEVIFILNDMLDTSKPMVYQARILDKIHISGAVQSSPSSYVVLSPWGSQSSWGKYNVSQSFYNSKRIGEEIKVFLKPGAFHIPYFKFE